MTLVEAIVLGLVQGVTEFLPISSTAHLRVVPALVGWRDPGAAFSAIIQLGTVAAVLLYFAKDVVGLTRAFARGLLARKPFEAPESRLAWAVGVGTVPIVIAGLAFKHAIEGALRGLWVISTSLVVVALVLFVVERTAKQDRGLETVTLKDGVVVGLWQMLALVPGSSRSGTTITGAFTLGFSREAATRFSFLLSIPSTTAAGVYQALKLLQAGPGEGAVDWAMVGVGTAVAFGSGLLAIHGLLRFVRTRTLTAFVVYRVVLGVTLMALLAKGVLVS